MIYVCAGPAAEHPAACSPRKPMTFRQIGDAFNPVRMPCANVPASARISGAAWFLSGNATGIGQKGLFSARPIRNTSGMRIVYALLLPCVLAGCPANPAPELPSSPPPAPEASPRPAAGPENSVSPALPSVEPTAPPSEDTVKTEAFHGVWATVDSQGEHFDMVIFPNGQAVTNWSKGLGGAKGERGFWRKENTRLIAVYEDGWTDVLTAAADGFGHAGFSPETPLGAPPTNTAPARRVAAPVATYTGVWRMNREPDGTYQYLALFSTGRAFSTVNGGTEGTWEASEQGARCTWPKDGWVDLIEPGPEGWQKRSWVGPESSTPADIAPATRVGEEKFQITP